MPKSQHRTCSAMLQPRNAVSERPGDAITPLVRVEGVSKAFSNGTGETRVLERASFEIETGQTASLTGVSGSGKSTLISLLGGFLRPDSGRLLLDDIDLAVLDDEARARLRAGRVGIV